VVRGCGVDVREILHDGQPTACVSGAAFAYVDAFTAHVDVGFFHGAALADPARLLEGTGRFMRHVKLRPGRDVDAAALMALIEAAYNDVRQRLCSPCSQVSGKPEAGMKKKTTTPPGKSASRLIDARIAELGDWRGETLKRIRALIRKADPDVVEEWKWRGVPVWSHDGLICTGETYRNVVKMTFARGASLADPAKLFNASLERSTRRAIDFREGGKIDGRALQALVRAAVRLNVSRAKQKRR
jgi:hypothetical protein